MIPTIHKGMEMPSRQSVFTPKQYPFDKMEVGDMFIVEREHRYRLHAAARHYRNKHKPGFRISTRAISETECGCWRIE